jgi:hypothetical protein
MNRRKSMYIAIIITVIIYLSVQTALNLGETDRVDWFPDHSEIKR